MTLVQTRTFLHVCAATACAVCRWMREHPWIYPHGQEGKLAQRIELTEHIPNAADTSATPRWAVIHEGTDLASVSWMRRWMRPLDGQPFRSLFYRDGLIVAVYGQHDFWLVIAHASRNPGLPIWVAPDSCVE